MAQRLISSVRKAGTILKSGLFAKNCKNLAQVQPKCLELRQFLSQLSAHPPPNQSKGFDKPSGSKEGNKSVAFTAGGTGTDPKSSSLSGGGDGQEGDQEKSSAGPSSDGNNKTKVLVAFGTAALIGVGWWVAKDFNWKGAVQDFLGRSTAECASMEMEVKNKGDETLQGRRNVPLQEITGDENEKQSVPANLAQLVIAANSTDPRIQYDAVASVRKLLSPHKKLQIDSLISCNILPTLVNCLDSKNPALQFEALSALVIIAGGTSKQTQAVVQAGAVPHFLKLITSPHPKICYVAVGGLGVIIADGPPLRDYMINLGVVAPLLKCIQPDIPIIFLSNVLQTVMALCHPNNAPLPPQTLREILPVLNAHIHHKDTSVLVNTVLALSFLTDGGKEQIQMVIDSGVLPKLVQLLSHHEVEVQSAVVRAVFNIVTGADDHSQAVHNCLALSQLHDLLNHPQETICKGAMCILATVTNGNCSRVQAVIDAGLVPLIMHHLDKGEMQTQMSPACSLSCLAFSGNKEQVAYLVDCGVIPPLCNLLNCKMSPAIPIMLLGILNILRMSVNQDGGHKACALIAECGGLDKIKSLQNHENIEIFMLAYGIIKNYFSGDDEKNAKLAPEAAAEADQLDPNGAMLST